MKKSRRNAREFALKALYQWQLSGNAEADIARHMREEEGFATADEDYFQTLLAGVTSQAEALDALLAPHLDRPVSQLSPIEHAILQIGAYEALHCLDVPYRVVINEAVELAKAYGGTEGHKYVNGVLDKLMPQARPAEVKKKA
ncbi:transcription antitermination factor NusB [Thiobacter aerophilum]|uniref:Transcription antitermination protein NusB n=1 Tax=Thiobacter aerophilum TaxID=3121275 RepID=A0ABV0EEU6_9BURK